MAKIIEAIKIVFKESLYIFLAVSLSLNLLAVYYFIFSQSTTFKVYFDSNTVFYNWAAIISSVIISLLFGLVFTFFSLGFFTHFNFFFFSGTCSFDSSWI